jgi:hypothetical protein
VRWPKHESRPDNPLRLFAVIFSKDRACQLDSLLRSMADNFRVPRDGVAVLYKATTKQFQAGYDTLVSRNILPDLTWVAEHSFKQDLVRICSGFDAGSLTMFLVDDNIVFRPLDNEAVFQAFSPRHLFICFRASRTYPDDVPPVFIKQERYLEWKWNYHKNGPVTWNYPFSVDGNVLHTRLVHDLTQRIDYTAPNSFEGRMHRYRHAWRIKRTKLALAPLHAAVVNNPLNRVQTEGETWHQGVSTEELNERYLAGQRINNTVLYACKPTAIHCALPVSFEKL